MVCKSPDIAGIALPCPLPSAELNKSAIIALGVVKTGILRQAIFFAHCGTFVGLPLVYSKTRKFHL